MYVHHCCEDDDDADMSVVYVVCMCDAYVTACIWAALPAAIGLFPQVSAINVSTMESKFHNLNDRNGNKINTLYFNKGL